MATNEYADWVPRILVNELDRDWERETEIEELCRHDDQLARIEKITGIFFTREDHLIQPEYN